MNRNRINRSEAGFGLLELILVMAVILFLFYFIGKFYLEKPQIDKETKKAVSEQGMDTGSYKSLVDTVKKKLQDSQAQEVKHANEMENLK